MLAAAPLLPRLAPTTLPALNIFCRTVISKLMFALLCMAELAGEFESFLQILRFLNCALLTVRAFCFSLLPRVLVLF